MAHLVRGCSKLARAGLPVSRRGLAKAGCSPCNDGAAMPKPTGKVLSGSAQEGTTVAKDCEFDFKKREIWPYDDSCGCTDPPPLAGCDDFGKPREACCRSVRQYGCHCEEEAEEDCEEEEQDLEPVNKECEIDFRKREVNPYDEPCGCTEPPATISCDTLNQGQACCRSSVPFGCECDAYERPGLDCTKQKAPPAQQKKKECGSKRPGTKCS